MTREWRIFFTLLFFLPGIWNPQTAAQELRISDFRLPETFYRRLDVSLNGGITRNREERPGSYSESGSDDAGTATVLYWLYTTNERAVMDIRPSLSISFAFSERQYSDSIGIIENARQQTLLRLAVPWQGSWYLQPDTWFVYSSASVAAQWSHRSTNDLFARRLPEYVEDRDYGYDVTAGAGAGFGKVRDGQSVFAILRVLDRLRHDSLLAREPTRDDVIALARIYSRRPMYLSLFDYPEKNFFGDLFSTLDSLGIVKVESLQPREILNVADVRLESIFPRLFGWKIQAGLEHSSFQWTHNRTDFRRFERGSIDYFLVTAEYGYDISLSTHFSANARRKASITRRIKKRAETDASFFVSHELTDRIESSLGYSYHWEDGDEFPFDVPMTSNHLSGGFRFYLENKVILGLRASYGQTAGGYRPGLERTNFGMSFDLTYRFF